MLRYRAEVVKDYPKPGVDFLAIDPILADPVGCQNIYERTREALGHDTKADLIAGIESRGFLVAGLVAGRMGMGLARIAKMGAKLGHGTLLSPAYDTEYSTGDRLKVKPALFKDRHVVIMDDLCATAGSFATAVDLVRRAGAASVVACIAVLDVPALRPQAKARLDVPLYILDA